MTRRESVLAALLLAACTSGCITPDFSDADAQGESPPAAPQESWTKPPAPLPPAASTSVPRAAPVTAPGPALACVRSLAGMTFVVDAGHGGKDPGSGGASGRRAEKDLALALAQEVANRLEERGGRVLMTRKGDVFVELDERAAQADRARADLFVSLHADWSQKSSASGLAVWIARSPLSASRRAAQEILAAARRAGIKTRSVQSSNFRVLVGHGRPGVLVECGFLSNAGDAEKLNTSWYRAKLAEAIVEGIAAALRR
ncbi:MAG: N-acetylmuramoyl-L-alanine amidase [Planctomycetes bacterium]|nr:N-acetylmuramoyl-L-alanine amidase [Planctomycetota bacterium]